MQLLTASIIHIIFMKKLASLSITTNLFLLLTINSLAQLSINTFSEAIRINQIGYYPQTVKSFVVVNCPENSFEIKDQQNKTVFSGKLSEKGTWDKSGENIKNGDFSSLTKTGVYKIEIKNFGVSAPFTISDNLYKTVLTASTKAFYYQRASTAISYLNGGEFARPAGHPDDTCYFHPSSGYNTGHINSAKGWYDAGDYNKYIVNGGVATNLLLSAVEVYPHFFNDGLLNIPESGNKINDLLDEIKWELDWFLTMQDYDGGVFFKLTNLSFDGFMLPHLTVEKRFVVGKSTSSALNFVAVTAQAARVFKNTDREYALKCLNAAKNAWEWAKINNNIEFKNPGDVKTGEYGSSDFKQDFYWAAVNLYITTNEKQYLDYITQNLHNHKFIVGGNWNSFLGYLASFSLVTVKNNSPETLKNLIKSQILQSADSLLIILEKNPYLQPLNEFVWGSNSDITSMALIFAHAYLLNSNKKYLNAAIQTTDYIFGKNATGYCFVTGFGSKQVKNVHHRLSHNNIVNKAIPGFLAGGPNFSKQDAQQVTYLNPNYPAKSYEDVMDSYASNEIAINWNAPLVLLLCILESNSK